MQTCKGTVTGQRASNSQYSAHPTCLGRVPTRTYQSNLGLPATPSGSDIDGATLCLSEGAMADTDTDTGMSDFERSIRNVDIAHDAVAAQ